MRTTKRSCIALLCVLASLGAASALASVDLAKVNGKSITDKDLEGALGNLNEGQRQGVLRDATSRRQILNSVIDQEVLIQEGEKAKIEQEKEYKAALDAFRRQYLATAIIQKNVGAKLTEKAAKSYYGAHKERYSTTQVHVQHILADDEPSARELMKRAKAPNADFQELAEKSSKDPSAKNNRGDIGFIGHDRFAPEFVDAAFDGKAGDIVGPVKTSYGYHVIKIVEKKIGKPLEYDEVELKVKNDLKQQLIQNFVADLRKQAKISVDDKKLDTL